MADIGRNDPFGSFRFLVEINYQVIAAFSEVSGLAVETETEDFREGGVNDYVHKIIKGSKHQPITLKRGLTDSVTLWQWHQDVVQGKIERKNGSIILLDSEGFPRWRWEFKEAFPAKWTGPDFKADSSAIAIEALELAHHGIKKG